MSDEGKNKLKPLDQMIGKGSEAPKINEDLNQALRTIKGFLDQRGNLMQQQAFQWICDHVIFIPVPEKRKNLELFKLLQSWLLDVLDLEAEEIAVILEKRVREMQHAESSSGARPDFDAPFELITIMDQVRRRKRTKRNFL